MLAFRQGDEQSERVVEGIPVVEKVRYLGVTISTNKQDMSREAQNAIRRNVALIKSRLRSAETEVKEQVMLSYVRSLLIYFGAPMAAARVWSEEKIERIEKELYREVHALPQDMNRNVVVNLVRTRPPAGTVIMQLAQKARESNDEQQRIEEKKDAKRDNEKD